MKLGAALLWDAIGRAARSEVTVHAVAADAKDEAAEGFYRHFGFVALRGGEGCGVVHGVCQHHS